MGIVCGHVRIRFQSLFNTVIKFGEKPLKNRVIERFLILEMINNRRAGNTHIFGNILKPGRKETLGSKTLLGSLENQAARFFGPLGTAAFWL